LKITVFTSNQPRHLALINSLTEIADTVYAVQECNTVFPGKIADFYQKSATIQRYFQKVIEAEHQIFDEVTFLPNKVLTLAVKSGDLNLLSATALAPALNSDYYIVFGASYIKGYLIDFLIKHRAYNIHMGISPYYRGNSCNFWALYDRKPEFVGATIHLLSKGLDSGKMLFYTYPTDNNINNPFLFSMEAVKSAHIGIIEAIKNQKLEWLKPVKQDRSKELRYSKNCDFTDQIAQEYLENQITGVEIKEGLKRNRVQMPEIN
jgi:hypothetical protein